jgi:heptosyltransferase-2
MEWSKILVRVPNWLGDAVMALPAIRALRDRFPAAHIAVLARSWVADLYRREPACGEMIFCGERGGLRGWARSWRLGKELRAGRFDAAILLPNAFEPAAVAWLAGIPRRIGYDRDGRGWLLSDAVPAPRPGEIPLHERYYYLELLRRAGILGELPERVPILLHGVVEARSAGEKLFRNMGLKGDVVGLSPGAQNSRAKQWLPERFADSAARLAGELGGSVAIFGSARERLRCQGIAEEVRRKGHPVLNLAGETTLAQFLDLAAACRVFLTNDSGAMHAASALGVPAVAVFGPTIVEASVQAGPCSLVIREQVD